MKTILSYGSIAVKKRKGPGMCDRGHQLTRAAYLFERNGVLQGVLGPICKHRIFEDPNARTIDDIFGPQSMQDLLVQATPADVRQYERMPVTPANRREILEAVLTMDRDQYLRVPKGVDIVPADADNFRKKGTFIRAQVPRSMYDIDIMGLTPEQAAMEAVADAPLGCYAGLAWMGNQLPAQRAFSLVSTIQGTRMDRILKSGIVPGTVKVEDYGTEVVFRIPSFTDEGLVYLGKVGKLPVNPDKPFSAAFETTGQCSCEDGIYNNLTHSDGNARGRRYANRSVRFGKHESAVLEMLAREKPDLTVDPRPMNPSATLMDVQWKLANRVLHGSRMLSGIEQEVLLWGATNPAYLGVDGAFNVKAA